MADLLVLPRPAQSLHNDAGFSEKLEHTAPAEKKGVTSVPQSEQVQLRRATFAKRRRNRAICPDRKVGESKGERELHLGERGDQSGRIWMKE